MPPRRRRARRARRGRARGDARADETAHPPRPDTRGDDSRLSPASADARVVKRRPRIGPPTRRLGVAPRPLGSRDPPRRPRERPRRRSTKTPLVASDVETKTTRRENALQRALTTSSESGATGGRGRTSFALGAEEIRKHARLVADPAAPRRRARIRARKDRRRPRSARGRGDAGDSRNPRFGEKLGDASRLGGSRWTAGTTRALPGELLAMSGTNGEGSRRRTRRPVGDAGAAARGGRDDEGAFAAREDDERRDEEMGRLRRRRYYSPNARAPTAATRSSKPAKLYACEQCLKYVRKKKTLAKHKAACPLRHPRRRDLPPAALRR